MRKLPGQGGITKKIASEIANRNREEFKKRIADGLSNLLLKVNQNKKIDMEVTSFSSSNDFPEQLLSILSFVKNVGIPIKWSIYSDGSHTDKQKKQIVTDFEFVTITSVDFNGVTSLEDIGRAHV